MREQIGRTVQTGPLPRGDSLTEVLGIPCVDTSFDARAFLIGSGM
ncbi:hypothetical protein RA2_02502 [Roseovarius sp. A-2]|nr:hypothetical protein RA2_02502 [Roseovarius sp. A-2]